MTFTSSLSSPLKPRKVAKQVLSDRGAKALLGWQSSATKPPLSVWNLFHHNFRSDQTCSSRIPCGRTPSVSLHNSIKEKHVSTLQQSSYSTCWPSPPEDPGLQSTPGLYPLFFEPQQAYGYTSVILPLQVVIAGCHSNQGLTSTRFFCL